MWTLYADFSIKLKMNSHEGQNIILKMENGVITVEKPKVKRTRVAYTTQDLRTALNAIYQGQSVHRVSKLTKIPYTTLRKKLETNDDEKRKSGTKPFLSAALETELFEWVMESQLFGVPKSRAEIILEAGKLAKESGQYETFGENGPSNGFVRGFCNRHEALVLRKLDTSSSMDALKEWFQTVQERLTTLGYEELLNDPSRNFSTEEASFMIMKKNGNIVLTKDAKDITVTTTFSATGTLMTPIIHFPEVCRKLKPEMALPSDVILKFRGDGSTDEISFMKYLQGLSNDLATHNIPKPVILWLDGNFVHHGIKASKLAKRLNIIIINLQPYFSEYIKPSTSATSIIAAYKDIFRKSKAKDPAFLITSANFCQIISFLSKDFDAELAVESFKKCGIHPFNFEMARCTVPVAMKDRGRVAFLIRERRRSFEAKNAASEVSPESPLESMTFVKVEAMDVEETDQFEEGVNYDEEDVKPFSVEQKVPGTLTLLEKTRQRLGPQLVELFESADFDEKHYEKMGPFGSPFLLTRQIYMDILEDDRERNYLNQ